MASRSRIVVVEEPLIVPLLRAVLRHGEYQIIAATSSEEAAQRTSQEIERIHLIITAADMPGARQFAVALRNKHPGLQVVLTCTSAQDECPFYGGGCLRLPCLMKPLDMTPDRILERVGAYLRQA